MAVREVVWVLAWLATSAGLGCSADDNAETTGTACPQDSALTYDTFGRAFFEEHCLSCHGSGGPQSPKLTTLPQIRERSSRIDALAAAGPDGVNTAMPPVGSVEVSERKKLGEWLACGAP
jgi:cytochrome c5